MAPLLLGILAAAVLPASAQAVYAPKLSIAIEPATPSSPIALTSTVTQAAGEEASRKVRVSFPAGFGFRLSVLGTLPACTEQQFAAGACPENTRIGSVDADAGFPVGVVSGGVYYGGAATGAPVLYAFLSNGLTKLLGMDQKLKATNEFRPDGGVDTVFDNLPTTATTRLTFAIAGGPNGVVSTPPYCGAFTFRGAFTSQGGATATSESGVTVAGCPPEPPPAKPRPRLSPISMAKVVSSRTGATARTRASVKGRLTVRLRKSAARNPFVTKRIAVGAAGVITIGRVGVGLKPGRYVLELSLAASGRTAKRTKAFRVR